MTHQLFPVIPHGKILYRGQLEVESINEAFYNTLLPGTHHDLQKYNYFERLLFKFVQDI